jgi:hypothetical protein
MTNSQARAARITVADLRLIATQDPRGMTKAELREWAIALSDVLPQVIAALDHIAVAARQVPPT